MIQYKYDHIDCCSTLCACLYCIRLDGDHVDDDALYSTEL